MSNRWCFNVKKKLKNQIKQAKQRQNDVNRTNNSGPGKDPKDPKKTGIAPVAGAPEKASVDEVKKQMKYTGNPKHHINSKGNASKPPHDRSRVLNESNFVKVKGSQNLEVRIGVENGKPVKFYEHAPGEYHGYIIEGKLDIESENVLKAIGWMDKTGKIIKK